MKGRLSIIALCGFILCVRSDKCQKDLLDHLFDQDKTDVDIRPGNDNEATNITMDASLFQIMELNERKQILELTMWFTISWEDTDYAWNPDQYCGLDEITVHSGRVWRPEIILYNSVSQEKRGMDVFVPTDIRLQHDGTRVWSTLAIISCSCQVQVASFPFDTQTCPLTFGSWTEDVRKLVLATRQDDIDKSAYQPNGEWKLKETRVHLSVYTSDNGAEWGQVPRLRDRIEYTLVLERRTGFYIINLVVPCVLLLMVGLLSFCLSPHAGDKISLTTTVLLTMMLFQIMVADSLPSTSTCIPLLTQFFTASVAILVICTASSVYVITLYNRGERETPLSTMYQKILDGPLPNWLGIHAPYLLYEDDDKISTSSSTTTMLFDDEIWNTKKQDPPKERKPLEFELPMNLAQQIYIQEHQRKKKHAIVKSKWRVVALVVDRVLMIVFVGMTLLLTIYFIIAATVGDPSCEDYAV